MESPSYMTEPSHTKAANLGLPVRHLLPAATLTVPLTPPFQPAPVSDNETGFRHHRRRKSLSESLSQTGCEWCPREDSNQSTVPWSLSADFDGSCSGDMSRRVFSIRSWTLIFSPRSRETVGFSATYSTWSNQGGPSPKFSATNKLVVSVECQQDSTMSRRSGTT